MSTNNDCDVVNTNCNTIFPSNLNIDLALSRVFKIYMVLAVEAHIEKLYLSTIVFDSLFYAGLYKEFFLYLLLVNSSSFANFGY